MRFREFLETDYDPEKRTRPAHDFQGDNQDDWHRSEVDHVMRYPFSPRRGPMGPLEEFASVLAAARSGWPPNLKKLALVGGEYADGTKSFENDPWFQRMTELARGLESRGVLRMQIIPDHLLVVGEPSAVEKYLRFHTERGENWWDSVSYHRDLGQMLGYGDEAIDGFLDKLRSKGRRLA